jgi:hypothetical protein
MRILLLNSCCEQSKILEIAEEVHREYSEITLQIIDPVKFSISEADSETVLLICFATKKLSDEELQAVCLYQEVFGEMATVIPVAIGSDKFIDAKNLEGIKSQNSFEINWLTNLVNRIGALLGLKCLSKEHQIFISYRQSDGAKISEDLSFFLRSLGFKVWRDEDRDEDNDGNLKAGDDVQATIKLNLHNSNIVLLVDTPEAPRSKWVNIEIDYAFAHLIPVLPVCFNRNDKKGSHFRKVKSLNRYCESDANLTNREDMANAIFLLLSDVYKRKRRISCEVSKKFIKKGYSWELFDKIKILFASAKKKKFNSSHRLITHCPLYDGIHEPLIKTFAQYSITLTGYNDKIYVYDGEIHADHEIEQIMYDNPEIDRSNIVILHHEQIEEFLSQ